MERLNDAEPAQAEELLLACCAARRWANELIARRPYHDLATLRRVSDAVFAELDWADIEQALAAHPRIGERAAGAGPEAAWSREEQSAAAGEASAARLAEGNAEYERRHGRVFLICATGLDAGAVLTALRQRLDNDEETERTVVREELRKIANLRLTKLVRPGETA